MLRRRHILLVAAVLSAACGKNGGGEEAAAPAIRIEQDIDAGSNRASFTVKAVNASAVEYGISEDMPLSIQTGTTSPVTLTLSIDGLEELREYTLYARGIGPGGEKGNSVTARFYTAKGPDNMYPWESSRTAIPSFADLSLVTMGWHNYNPPVWTEERFASHVSYDGKWLFDAFLCIDGWDPVRGLSYSITPNRRSAVKDSWQDLADAWLGEDGALEKLDRAISGFGTPPSPRHIVMSVPDPVRYSEFGDPSSTTTYWGETGGETMDFSRTDHQVKACKWYMDLCRELFMRRGFKNIQLAGFYILSEELPLNPDFYKAAGQSYKAGVDDWNWSRKNWEIIIPQLSSYAHSCNEGLWWIPYRLAPGYKVWKNLGFDMVWMQPNYYWDHDAVSHPLKDTFDAIRKYGMGMELEFEFSLVASVMADGRGAPDGSGATTFYAKDVPMLRNRVREYMSMYLDSGNYGKYPIAVYSGTDAWHQLATSSDAGDKEMFREICNFITESPLKR